MYKGYIYRHWLVNDESIEKSYVGQTSRDETKDRWNDGKGYLYVNGVGGEEADHKMARAIRKYGWHNFNHETLLTIECETEEELSFWLDQWEQYFIEKYDSFYNGYNSTLGGGGCRGYKMSEEDRQKISDGRKGMKFTEEHKQHLSDSKKQKFASGEITVWNIRAVICLEYLEHPFSNMEEAKLWCNGCKSTICNCCKGKRKSSGRHPITGEKLHWMYYDEYLKQKEVIQ